MTRGEADRASTGGGPWLAGLRWGWLLPRFLLLSQPANRPPGERPDKGRGACPRCGKRVSRATKHSAECVACGWFLFATCPSGADHVAVSWRNGEWRCGKEHHFDDTLLCPRCWEVGRRRRGTASIQCSGREKHVFYVRKERCRACGGYVATAEGDVQWVCTACGVTEPVGR